MGREAGFYWIMSEGIWLVAEWTNLRWLVTGQEESYQDHEWDEINETRILPPQNSIYGRQE